MRSFLMRSGPIGGGAFLARGGAREFDDLDGFLGHKARGGGGGKFLTKWKEKGTCDTWLHTKRLPLALWRHGFPMYVVKEDKDSKDKVKHVYPKRFVCHEEEATLLHPWRDKETGEREHPPKRCGLCKFEDWLWMQCQAWVDTHTWDDEKKTWREKKKGGGKGLDPCTMMFDFESEASAKENVSMYAGAMCGFLGQKNLDDEVKKAARAAKIRLDELFKQSIKPKCEYVLCVVDNDNIAAGVQIATETQALGEKIKEIITKQWKKNERNIQKSPYVIQWEYKEKEEFSKKYDATALMNIKPSERVLKLIRGEAPDLTEMKEMFNQQSMRSTLEKHCLISDQIPWDDLFPTAEQSKKWREDDEAADEEEEASGGEDDDADDSSGDGDGDDAGDGDDSDDGDEEVACDECKKPMKLSATKCPHCGKKYGDEEEEEEEEEKPKEEKKLKTRAEMAKEKADAKKAKGKDTGKSSKKSKSDDDEDPGDQDSEIPF